MGSSVDVINVFWDSCWNQRRTDRLAEVFHDPFTLGQTQVSVGRLAGIIAETVASLPDLRVHVTEIETVDEVVMSRSRLVAAHGGVIFGLSPTGRSVDVPSLDIFFFCDGRVTRYWHLTDHLPILIGIGAEVRIGDQMAQLH